MKKRKVKLFASIASLGLVVAVMGVGVWAATQQAVKVSSQVSFTATSVAADITLQVHNNTTTLENSSNKGANDIVEKASIALTEDQETGKYAYDENLTLTNLPNTTNPGTIGVEQYVARFVNDTAKTFYDNRVYLKVADKDEDGYLNKGAEIVYEFVIKAHTSSAPIYYEVYANLFDTPFENSEYTIDQVFDVTVTDTYLHKTDDDNFSKTTNVATGERSTQVMITNWTDPDTDTTGDNHAVQPVLTQTDYDNGKKTATTPENLNQEGDIIHTYGEERRITVTYTVKDLGSDYQGIAYTMTGLDLGDIYIKVANNGNNLDGLPEFEVDITDQLVDKVVDWGTGKDDNLDGEPLTGKYNPDEIGQD